MELILVELSSTELSVLRQALDLITVSGKDAKFISNLQSKLESEIAHIQSEKAKEDQRKQKELQEVLKAEAKKQNS